MPGGARARSRSSRQVPRAFCRHFRRGHSARFWRRRRWQTARVVALIIQSAAEIVAHKGRRQHDRHARAKLPTVTARPPQIGAINIAAQLAFAHVRNNQSRRATSWMTMPRNGHRICAPTATMPPSQPIARARRQTFLVARSISVIIRSGSGDGDGGGGGMNAARCALDSLRSLALAHHT